MTPIVNDAYRLRKLLEKATGIKVYKSDLLSNYFNCYLSITQEYKNETNPHITVAQGDWSIVNGGEYKFHSIHLQSSLKARRCLILVL